MTSTPPDKKKPSVLQRLDFILDKVEKIDKLTHAGLAMVVAAALDRMLEEALLTRMNKLNSEMSKKLFGDYGSLRDLSIKIDLSFALGLVDRETYKRLTTVRKVRNVFAHTIGFVDFDTPNIRTQLHSLADESSKPEPIVQFMSIAAAIESAITTAAGLPHRGIIAKINAER